MAKKATQRSKAKAAAAKDTGDGSGEAADGQLFETEVNVTPEVRSAADKYKRAKVSKGNADRKYRSAKEDLIDEMIAAECERVRITVDGVQKWICLEDEPKIHEETVKEPAPVAAA